MVLVAMFRSWEVSCAMPQLLLNLLAQEPAPAVTLVGTNVGGTVLRVWWARTLWIVVLQLCWIKLPHSFPHSKRYGPERPRAWTVA